MKILNFGSLNMDYVYQVPHFVQPGETLAAGGRSIKLGGKGLNQSIALARAGARVCHAGCIGQGGEELKRFLEENGVDTEGLMQVPDMQGHTVIQVNPQGENCILLYGGSNLCQSREHIARTMERFAPGDWVLLQNEISLLPEVVEEASRAGLRIVLNPSPCNERLQDVDFGCLSWLVVNEVEAEQITGEQEPEKVFAALHARWPELSLLMTLGSRGSRAFRVSGGETEKAQAAALRVQAVDTTGAGDTYTGFFVAGLMEDMPLKACMERASRAAAISVTRPGAAESVPWRKELEGEGLIL